MIIDTLVNTVCRAGHFKSNQDQFIFKWLNQALLLVAHGIIFLNKFLLLFHMVNITFLFHCLMTQVILNPLQLLLFSWSFLELTFYSYLNIQMTKININSLPIRPELKPLERKKALDQVVNTSANLKELIQGWLLMYPLNGIRRSQLKNFTRQHAEHWVKWKLFAKLDHFTSEEQDEIKGYMEFLDTKLEYEENQKDFNSNDYSYFNMEKVPFTTLPLFIYAGVWMVQQIFESWILSQGFVLDQPQGSSIGVYIKKLPDDNHLPPIVFVHGLGLGPTMYWSFVRQIIQRYPNRTILILKLDYISMKLVTEVPSLQYHRNYFQSVYQRYHLRPSTWITHSFGSVVPTYLSKLADQKLIQNLHLLEPISIDLFKIHLTTNFYFKSEETPFELFVRQFLGNELSVSNYFFRNFWWDEVSFFPNQVNNIPNKTKVYLSTDDCIVDFNSTYDTIQRFFTTEVPKNRFEVQVWKSVPHGNFLWDLSNQRQIFIDFD